MGEGNNDQIANTGIDPHITVDESISISPFLVLV